MPPKAFCPTNHVCWFSLNAAMHPAGCTARGCTCQHLSKENTLETLSRIEENYVAWNMTAICTKAGCDCRDGCKFVHGLFTADRASAILCLAAHKAGVREKFVAQTLPPVAPSGASPASPGHSGKVCRFMIDTCCTDRKCKHFHPRATSNTLEELVRELSKAILKSDGTRGTTTICRNHCDGNKCTVENCPFIHLDPAIDPELTVRSLRTLISRAQQLSAAANDLSATPNTSASDFYASASASTSASASDFYASGPSACISDQFVALYARGPYTFSPIK